MNVLRKNKDLFPPYMVDGIDLLSVSRRIYLQYSESFNALIISIIFINYIFFCRYLLNNIQSEEGNVIFQIMTIIISTIILIDFIVKITIIRPLYLNRYYYGNNLLISYPIRRGIHTPRHPKWSCQSHHYNCYAKQ